jgi:hypothetical protein
MYRTEIGWPQSMRKRGFENGSFLEGVIKLGLAWLWGRGHQHPKTPIIPLEAN